MTKPPPSPFPDYEFVPNGKDLVFPDGTIEQGYELRKKTDFIVRNGIGGHHNPSMLKDEWLTPPEIVLSLGSFDLDPCAPVARHWNTALNHYTIEDNGLTKPWFGRVWLNPPYGGPNIIGPWMRRMADHNCGIALTFARTETVVFFETVWNKASSVLFIAGRLYFYHSDGRRALANSGGPSVLISYGESDAGALRNSGIIGKWIDLR